MKDPLAMDDEAYTILKERALIQLFWGKLLRDALTVKMIPKESRARRLKLVQNVVDDMIEEGKRYAKQVGDYNKAMGAEL